MTYSVLKVDEIGYDTVEVTTDGQSIFFITDVFVREETQTIKIPLADWPQVKAFVDEIYFKILNNG